MRKFYIVDDDDDDRMFLKEAVHAVLGNVEIVEQTDGQDLLKALEIDDFDKKHIVICTDMNMPKIDGFDVIEFLQSQSEYRNIPVFMISTTTCKELIEKAYKLGVRKYFVKPYKICEYSSIVQEIAS
ncbi:response regulator [Dyadobacter koreensis]|nr:response regulator [Dyadobacter koreensis]